jgi:hypothetical protein
LQLNTHWQDGANFVDYKQSGPNAVTSLGQSSLLTSKVAGDYVEIVGGGIVLMVHRVF